MADVLVEGGLVSGIASWLGGENGERASVRERVLAAGRYVSRVSNKALLSLRMGLVPPAIGNVSYPGPMGACSSTVTED